jgi:hypothetical protein
MSFKFLFEKKRKSIYCYRYSIPDRGWRIISLPVVPNHKLIIKIMYRICLYLKYLISLAKESQQMC